MLLRAVFLYRACDKGSAGPGERSEDSRLIIRLQTGDLAALGELFERYKGVVYRIALAMTRDERVAEDILQECFVRLYTYVDSVDAGRPLKPWLYRVTVNLSYDWSAKKHSIQPLDDVLEWLSGLQNAFPAPDDKVEERELMRAVREVIAELPAFHRAVIVLYYMENLTVAEVADVLQLPAGTVKSRLHYARERLRDALLLKQRPVPEMAYEFT